ncbi:MAG: YtxH domain-containing protein [Solirubrobacteraceae bacterium]
MTLADLTSRLPAVGAHLPSQSQIARMFAARERRSPAEFAAVFALGLIVGGVAALLHAPKTGKQLRSEIAKRAGKLRDSARERIGTNGHAKNEQVARL